MVSGAAAHGRHADAQQILSDLSQASWTRVAARVLGVGQEGGSS